MIHMGIYKKKLIITLYMRVFHITTSLHYTYAQTFAISIFLPTRAQPLRGFVTTRTTKILTVRIGETFPTVATPSHRHVRRLVASDIALAALLAGKVLLQHRTRVQPPQINVVADIPGPVTVQVHITDLHSTRTKRPPPRHLKISKIEKKR